MRHFFGVVEQKQARSFASWVFSAEPLPERDEPPSGGSGVSYVEGRRLGLEVSGLLGRDDALWEAHAKDADPSVVTSSHFASLEY